MYIIYTFKKTEKQTQFFFKIIQNCIEYKAEKIFIMVFFALFNSLVCVIFLSVSEKKIGNARACQDLDTN